MIKIRRFSDILQISKSLNKELTIDLSETNNKERLRIIDFLAGLTYFNGSFKKIDKDNYLIKLK